MRHMKQWQCIMKTRDLKKTTKNSVWRLIVTLKKLWQEKVPQASLNHNTDKYPAHLLTCCLCCITLFLADNLPMFLYTLNNHTRRCMNALDKIFMSPTGLIVHLHRTFEFRDLNWPSDSALAVGFRDILRARPVATHLWVSANMS